MANEDLAERARTAMKVVAQAIPEATGNAELQPAVGMLQTRSPYATAVQVLRPRDLKQVQRKCQEEAAFAGDALFYSWKQGGETIEGPSVQCTNIAARNWGNSAVNVLVEETADAFIFHGTFIDLETGYNYSRPFRMNKQSPKTKQGKDIYQGDRGKDIIFQIGASKAARNAVANSVPRWLIDEMVEIGKANVVKKFADMGPEKARAVIIRKAAAQGVTQERLEAKYGHAKAWEVRDFIELSSAIRAIEDGIESADDLFPGAAGKAEVVEEKKEEPRTESDAPPTVPPAQPPVAVQGGTEKPKQSEAVAGYEQAIDLVETQEQAVEMIALLGGAVASEKITDAERNVLIGRLADRESKFKKADEPKVRELTEAQKKEVADALAKFTPNEEIVGFGTHKTKTWASTPTAYLEWLVAKHEDPVKRAKASKVLEMRQEVSPA